MRSNSPSVLSGIALPGYASNNLLQLKGLAERARRRPSYSADTGLKDWEKRCTILEAAYDLRNFLIGTTVTRRTTITLSGATPDMLCE